VSGLIEKRGFFLTFLLIFLGGLALNLTPCIYPLIPITISFFVGQADGKTSHTFFLALIYVLGMSITYSALGIIAATTGSLFGAALQNPWVIVFIIAVLVGLATSMFGLWEIRLPMFLTRRTGTARKGHLGALFMGLTVGLVAAPCIGPFVIGLLTYVGEIGRPILGFLMFFTLAWGMGIPFIVLGTISGSISSLPRSGDWMVWIRKVFGFILIAMAFYFARHIIGIRLTMAAYSATALVAGLYLGWIDRTGKVSSAFNTLRRLVGIAAIAGAIVMLFIPGGLLRSRERQAGIEWIPFSMEQLDAATREGKPVMIDFSADWCIPCRELDHKTFSDPAVIALAENVVNFRADLTRSDKAQKQLKKHFNILGVPTILFIDTSGMELRELRVTGFAGPKEIERRLKSLVTDPANQ
jgi:thiol:disulfide interchange protein DsbD